MEKKREIKFDIVEKLKKQKDKTDYKTLDLLHGTAYVFSKMKLDQLASKGNYFEKDRLIISWAMQGILENVLRNDLLVIQRFKNKKLIDIEGIFIHYNLKTGYKIKEDTLRNFVEQLFYIPERIDKWIETRIGSKNLKLPDPFQHQILFPKTVELLITKPGKNKFATYYFKDALKDAFNEIKKNYNVFQNALWFEDTENMLKKDKDIKKVTERFKKFIIGLPPEIRTKLKVY